MSRRKGRGRYWFALGLAVFLLVATAVIARQKSALETAGRLRRLRDSTAALEASRAELERRIRVATTTEALLPKVARLGLVIPSDTAGTILVIDPPDSAR